MGKSQSGKTTLAVKIASWIIPKVEQVIVCSATIALQPTWNRIKPSINFSFESFDLFLTSVLKILLEDEYKKKTLIILDDVSFEKRLNEGSKGIISQLAYNAIWYNITMIVVCHKASNISAGFRENVEHLILFQTIDSDELEKLAKFFSITGKKKDLIELYKAVVVRACMNGEPHTFLYICFKDGISIYKNFTHSIKFE
jgi:GTPase SAR1 family protein